jgi:hypothetical protein
VTPHGPNVDSSSGAADLRGAAGASDEIGEDNPRNEDRRSLLTVAVDGFRTAVIDLERIAQEANRASDRARHILTILELECEDGAEVTATETTVYLEPLQSPGSNPGSPVNRHGNGCEDRHWP